MLQPDRAGRVADAFGLGGNAVLVGPVATGRLGRIWRLTADRGAYAVKDSQLPIDPAEVARDAVASRPSVTARLRGLMSGPSAPSVMPAG